MKAIHTPPRDQSLLSDFRAVIQRVALATICLALAACGGGGSTTTGFAIFLAMLFLFVKIPRRWLLRLLCYDMAIDVSVTLVLIIHFGTFSGLVGATVAEMMTSITTSAGKRLFGYIKGSEYHYGTFRLHI
jgi:hypothetical protein